MARMSRQIPVTLTQTQREILESLANDQGVSRAEVIRRLIKNHWYKLEDERRKPRSRDTNTN